MKKQTQVAEARARRAEKEANELKTKLDAAMKAAADGPQEREDPALRDVSSEVALFALESDVRIKTQELREAQAQSKERQGRIESYAARVRQLEGGLETEREQREKATAAANATARRAAAVHRPGVPSPPPSPPSPVAAKVRKKTPKVARGYWGTLLG